jgi:hypothetical protein
MSTQPLPSEPRFRLDHIFRSDNLVSIREFVAALPELQLLVEQQILQIRTIVDANIVQGELRWRVGSRRNPHARSGMEEAIDAGVLVLIAPNFLKSEIGKYLPKIARDANTSLSEVEQEWRLFQTKLHFYEPSSCTPDGFVVDPKDMPYKAASDELRLPVYTRDKDLTSMGAPVLWVCIDAACRDHARAASIALGFTMGFTGSVIVGVQALRAVLQTIKSLLDGFKQFPPWVQIFIAGALAAVLAHPKSRARLWQSLKSAYSSVCVAKGPLLDGLMVLVEQIACAQSETDRTRREIQSVLPPAEKAPALVLARRICVLSTGPLTIEEIAWRMRSAGYLSRAKNFGGYLRRVLRESGQFVEVSHGFWRLV